MSNLLKHEDILAIVDNVKMLDSSLNIYGSKEDPLFLVKEIGICLEYRIDSVNKLVRLASKNNKEKHVHILNNKFYKSWFVNVLGLVEILETSKKYLASIMKNKVLDLFGSEIKAKKESRKLNRLKKKEETESVKSVEIVESVVEEDTGLKVFTFENQEIDYAIFKNRVLFNLRFISELIDVRKPGNFIDLLNEDYVVSLNNFDFFLKDNDKLCLNYSRRLKNYGELFLTKEGLSKLIELTKGQTALRFQKWLDLEFYPELNRKPQVEHKTTNKPLIKADTVDKLNKINNNDKIINNEDESNNILNYNNHKLTVIDRDGEPWFVAKEVCKILEHSNYKVAIQSLDEDEVSKVYLIDSLGRNQETLIVSESGLYTLIIRSNKSKAKDFRKWITNKKDIYFTETNKLNENQNIEDIIDSKQLQVFKYENHTLDYVIYNNEPLFKMSSVGKILDIANPHTSIDTKDLDYVIKLKNSDIKSKLGKTEFKVLLHNHGEMFLTEAGLYRLIMRSNKPSAEKFQKWVVKEVLPTIRKTGSYSISVDKTNVPEVTTERDKIDKVKLLKSYSDLYRDKYEGRYSQIMDSYAIKELTGRTLLPLPERPEHYYTATEIADRLGITANRVGRIANEYGLKNDNNGKWFFDKAKYSDAEVETFKYNEKGFKLIKQILLS